MINKSCNKCLQLDINCAVCLLNAADANLTGYVYDSSTRRQVSRVSAATPSSSGNDVAPPVDDIDVRVEVATSAVLINARDDAEYEVVMTSLLCLGSAVVLTSFLALVATAVRRRLQRRCDRRLVMPSLAASQFLAGTAFSDIDKKNCFYPTGTITSCSTLIGSGRVVRPEVLNQSAFTSDAVVMTAGARPCSDRHCNTCAAQRLAGRSLTTCKADAEVRLMLTWPQKAVYCDSSRCCSSMDSIAESCASVWQKINFIEAFTMTN